MVVVWFPGMYIPELTIPQIKLLDVWLVGVHLKIVFPKVTLTPRITIWESFKIFDSSWISIDITDLINAIPTAVWNLCKAKLDEWTREYYEAHSEGEE